MDNVFSINNNAVLWSAPADQREGRPLLVLMHGYGSDEADLFSLVPFLPDQPVVASIRAPHREGPGFAWYPLNFETPGRPAESEVHAAVSAVLRWLEQLPSSPSLGLLGFSQGGAMALQLMRAEPHRFSYAVQLSGFSIDFDHRGDSELSRLRPPVFWGRGTHDAVIPTALVDQTERWLPLHSTLEARIYKGLGHSIAEQELIDVAAFITAQLQQQ